MSLHYTKTINNTCVVQLEKEDRIKDILTENRAVAATSEVQDIIRHMALTEIIS